MYWDEISRFTYSAPTTVKPVYIFRSMAYCEFYSKYANDSFPDSYVCRGTFGFSSLLVAHFLATSHASLVISDHNAQKC